MFYPPFDTIECDNLLHAALEEDIGRGDITSNLTIDNHLQAEFILSNRAALVVCGLSIAARIFHLVDDTIELTCHYTDGSKIEAGGKLLSGRGPAKSILAAERTALNLLQHLSGIATLTERYVSAIEGTKAVILDTRKTIPGLRGLQKYAVKTGGGRNHRLRLDDGILIKDNHISICGSITEAVRKARAGSPSLTAIEVECDTLEQVREAAATEANVIMLDNMGEAMLRQAVELVNGKALLEASGNVSLENIRTIAETGVDFISIGKLTHSAPACDIGLDIVIL